jgi:hypothetical protein
MKLLPAITKKVQQRTEHTRFIIARVTRLGEFSLVGHFFTLGCFLKVADVAFFHDGYVLILTKAVWASFWAIFKYRIRRIKQRDPIVLQNNCPKVEKTIHIFRKSIISFFKKCQSNTEE